MAVGDATVCERAGVGRQVGEGRRVERGEGRMERRLEGRSGGREFGGRRRAGEGVGGAQEGGGKEGKGRRRIRRPSSEDGLGCFQYCSSCGRDRVPCSSQLRQKS